MYRNRQLEYGVYLPFIVTFFSFADAFVLIVSDYSEYESSLNKLNCIHEGINH